MTAVTEPIFIGGPGRSGTTLLLQILSTHPDVAWFSGWTNRFPTHPALAIVSRVMDLEPLEQKTRGKRKWPRPAEAHGIWNHYFPGFSYAERDWTAADADPARADAFRAFVAAHLRWQGKPRFLTKYTGWPRFDFLRALYADARLLHIERDPRAVVASYMKQRWGYKDDPRGFEAMTPDQRVELYTARYLRLYEARMRFVEGSDYFHINYEELIRDVVGTMAAICEKAKLPFSPAFERRVRSFEIREGSNDAWKKNLSPREQGYMTELLAKPISEMSYAR